MSVRAVLEGALIGLGAAFVLAVILALVDYQVAVSPGVETGLIWTGAAITALAAGWAGGRLAGSVSWFHGALAAVTLNLVATVIAETLHINNVTHLWLGLAVAALAGLAGGLMGAATQ
jgi:hydroxylaminobenzene mutase